MFKKLLPAVMSFGLTVASMGAVIVSGSQITFDQSSVDVAGSAAVSALSGVFINWQMYIPYVIAISFALFGLRWITKLLLRKGGGQKRR